MEAGVRVTRYISIHTLVSLTTNCGKKSCEASKWIEHEDTQVVQTCWAAMALMYAQYPDIEPIEKATQLVMARQKDVSRYSPSSSQRL